jgi:hypothetical protein
MDKVGCIALQTAPELSSRSMSIDAAVMLAEALVQPGYMLP